jgi:hypothetical protein
MELLRQAELYFVAEWVVRRRDWGTGGVADPPWRRWRLPLPAGSLRVPSEVAADLTRSSTKAAMVVFSPARF